MHYSIAFLFYLFPMVPYEFNYSERTVMFKTILT